MQKEFIEVGKIVNIKGINGEVKIVHWCDGLEILYSISNLYFGEGAVKINIEYKYKQNSFLILKIFDVNDRNQAQKLKNKVIYAKRKDIIFDENSYFIEDLVGINVIDRLTFKTIGVLKEVIKSHSADVYVVENCGKKYLIPAISELEILVDLNKNKMLITPIEGILDEN